jgi:serine/threonine protein kinase
MPSPPENLFPPNAPVRAGDVIAGKYRVERALGQGGMGLVVEAKRVDIGGLVAIKLLLPGVLERPGAVERFLREGRTTAIIRSEHVALVHDAGLLPGGLPYLVLERLEGLDLRSLLRKRGPLSVDSAVTYVLQACEALAGAHALGIVHRDIKPSNLFLTRRADRSKIVKLIDFGVSKAAPPDRAGSATTLTASETPMGTLHYMAPEQMRSARDVDALADVWSLGATLYGLLTGSPPFPGDSIVAVYDRIMAGAPAPLTARPDVPSGLEEVVLRCLRVDPLARHGDVGELALALAAFAPETSRIHADRARRIAEGLPPETDSLDVAITAEDVTFADAPPQASARPSLEGTPTVVGMSPGEGARTAPAMTGGAREPSWPKVPRR